LREAERRKGWGERIAYSFLDFPGTLPLPHMKDLFEITVKLEIYLIIKLRLFLFSFDFGEFNAGVK